MDLVYEKIDGLLFYPPYLAYKEISGVINARIVLNDKGRCLQQFTSVEGASQYLRSYISNLIRKFCSVGIHTNKPLRPVTNLDLSFHFEIEAKEVRFVDIDKKIVGNVLLFHRGTPKSPLEWEIGPIRGVFPVPTVYLNTGWIYEQWDKIILGQDPMDEYRKE